MTPTIEKMVEERFWQKVKKTSKCWEWTGYTSTRGYGRFNIGRKTYQAHWIPFMLRGEKMPVGLVCDHLCRNRACVNPKHIQFVTAGENVMRGIGITAKNAKKTKCHMGHKLSGTNLILKKGLYNPEERVCRICKNIFALRSHNKHKAERMAARKKAKLARMASNLKPHE